MSKIKAYIFDLDGVIADTALLHFQAWKTIASELDIAIDIHFNECLKGVSRRQSLINILTYGNVRLDDDEIEYWMERKNEIYVRSLENLSPNDILPGILEFIKALKVDGLLIGIASASNNAINILDKLKLTEQIDYIANPKQIERPKPAPDIFLDVANHFELKASQCVGIEDAQAGIEAINQAQMFSIGIGQNLTGAQLTYACTTAVNYEEVKKLVNKLKKGENNE